MRVLQILLLLTIVVGVISQFFGDCTDGAGGPEICPADATCVAVTNGTITDQCACNSGFYAYDTGVSVDGDPETACTPIVCLPGEPNQCSRNGDCEVMGNRYFCDCDEGFTGDLCDMPITAPTTMTTMSTTTRRGNVGAILAAGGAGLLALVVLGAGAAALASSSG